MVTTNHNASIAVSLVAGGTAGGVEAAVTYPFEFAKTRAQLRESAGTRATTNPFVAVRDAVKQQGLKSLYVGCGALVVGSIGKDAIRFLAFDSIKRRFGDPSNGRLTTSGNLLAGVASGIIASTIIVTPTERVKTGLIDDARRPDPQFRSTSHAIIQIARTQGLSGLWRGYVGTTLKQVGATGFRLGSYHIMRDACQMNDIRSGPALDFAMGAVAGFVTTIATQPFDVIKTRSQSVDGVSTVRAVKEVLSDYGVRGFWKGTTMRLGRTVFSGGILFTVYERVVKILEPSVRAAL